jgi:site-specific recombinase XerD
MRLDEALKRYRDHLRVERNLAPRTITAYTYELGRLERSLAEAGQPPSLEEITSDHLRSHLMKMQRDGYLASATTARTVSSLKGFFGFCVEQGFLPSDPAAFIRAPKRPKRLPIFLVQDEVVKMLSAQDTEDWRGKRDLAILTTLVFTGLRLHELVAIDHRALNLQNRTLRVVGKGRKERIVPLNDLVLHRIREYLDVRPASKTEALFLNRFGKRLSGKSVERLVRQAVIRAGIPQSKITPHKLRHTFATLLHMNEVDIIEIQALLGHANISSTQIYTHTNTGRLRSAVDKLGDIPV